jgi:hypothetical protein
MPMPWANLKRSVPAGPGRAAFLPQTFTFDQHRPRPVHRFNLPPADQTDPPSHAYHCSVRTAQLTRPKTVRLVLDNPLSPHAKRLSRAHRQRSALAEMPDLCRCAPSSNPYATMSCRRSQSAPRVFAACPGRLPFCGPFPFVMLPSVTRTRVQARRLPHGYWSTRFKRAARITRGCFGGFTTASDTI